MGQHSVRMQGGYVNIQRIVYVALETALSTLLTSEPT